MITLGQTRQGMQPVRGVDLERFYLRSFDVESKLLEMLAAQTWRAEDASQVVLDTCEEIVITNMVQAMLEPGKIVDRIIEYRRVHRPDTGDTIIVLYQIAGQRVGIVDGVYTRPVNRTAEEREKRKVKAEHDLKKKYMKNKPEPQKPLKVEPP